MSERKINILIIEDEEFDVNRIKNTLHPYRKNIVIVQIVSNGKDALECLNKNRECDVIIMDYQISGGLIGESLLHAIKKIDNTIQIIVITKMTLNQTDIYFANQLLEAGAYWFGTKYPADIEEYIYQPTDFILTITNAYERRKLEQQHLLSQEKLESNIKTILSARPLIGDSPALNELRELVDRYAESNANVLITGESGTGKELIAMNLHYKSSRRFEPFVTVNCAAIPKDLIESELFGFVKGAFTGAKEEKKGLFEQANLGTIFLDEIGELPHSLQAKLLRVLESGELDKIGRKKKYQVDVRVISATNQDIKEMVKGRTFREDLYYRLNILRIRSLPLSELKQDIPNLIHYHLHYFGKDLSIVPPKITKQAMDEFINFGWPGNVRQLKNVIQRILALRTKEVDRSIAHDVLGLIKNHDTIHDSLMQFSNEDLLPLKEVEYTFRKNYVAYVREKSSTDAEAARKLGLAPPNFHRMCKELGLKD
ncbi:MAG: sigma-54-dependent Fis family transcriptional regulator [Candidatus Marinimicrobia bacterium]|nr:sigma-54-dependent Fis family transcriptional regulator [Candidatus Neomarinimicrobiota bacterium]